MAQLRILAETPKDDFGVMTALLMAAAAVTTATQIQAIRQTEYIPQFAEGGLINGPGTGTSDSIMARVSNGEFVMNAKSTKQNLPLLTAMNNGNGVIMSDPKLTATLNMLGTKIEMLDKRMSIPSKAYIIQNEVYNGVQAVNQLNTRRRL
jgi:hypothetical protein